MSILWLRAEVKPFESRTPLVPQHARQLILDGHDVVVEKSSERIFSDKEYADIGCQLVDAGSWSRAPKEAFILGIKYLPMKEFPLVHRHIYFAHAYNAKRVFHEKAGVNELLQRFKDGKGIHYDIEFLVNDEFKRVAAFGTSAGVAGASIALLVWGQKMLGNKPPFKIPHYYADSKNLFSDIKTLLSKIKDQKPSVLIIGGFGRCGKGVKYLLAMYGLTWTLWGRKETGVGGQLPEIVNYNILFNCAYITEKTPSFLTVEKLQSNKCLSIVADISCETSGNNPLPIYDGVTTYENPTRRLTCNNKPLDVIAIDNLPAFLPYESSLDFSTQLLPYLKCLLNGKGGTVWNFALNVFNQSIKT